MTANIIDTIFFDKMRSRGSLKPGDPELPELTEAVTRTLQLVAQLNASGDTDQVRNYLSKITGTPIDQSTRIFPPFYTNFGRFTTIGRNVFINHACSFLDIGGITIEDDVKMGPRVNLITENHPLNPAERQTLLFKPITIKRNAWIGAAATILPGVTIGENAVVAAGALVSKDVEPNTIVAGVPAKFIRKINS
jgi:acetyltransferase-like isoleucine patch superfamily enzyme